MATSQILWTMIYAYQPMVVSYSHGFDTFDFSDTGHEASFRTPAFPLLPRSSRMNFGTNSEPQHFPLNNTFLPIKIEWFGVKAGCQWPEPAEDIAEIWCWRNVVWGRLWAVSHTISRTCQLKPSELLYPNNVRNKPSSFLFFSFHIYLSRQILIEYS